MVKKNGANRSICGWWGLHRLRNNFSRISDLLPENFIRPLFMATLCLNLPWKLWRATSFWIRYLGKCFTNWFFCSVRGCHLPMVKVRLWRSTHNLGNSQVTCWNVYRHRQELWPKLWVQISRQFNTAPSLSGWKPLEAWVGVAQRWGSNLC